jgi:hypothetical protein
MLIGLLALSTVVHQAPPSVLEVSFSVRPVLGEPGRAPKLTVDVKNGGAKAVPFMRFSQDDCYAQMLLVAELETPAGKVAAAPNCAILSWPGVKGTLAPGAVDHRELSLSVLFPSVAWTKGRYRLDLSWSPHALAKQFPDYAQGASRSSLSGDTFVMATKLATVRVEPGKTVSLPDGARYRFDGHSHKMTKGDDESPLIVSSSFAPGPAGPLESSSVNVEPRGPRSFELSGRTFVLQAYEYGRSMELTYYGQLPP